MDTFVEYEGQPNVIFAIHWTLTGVNGDYTASVDSVTGVSFSEDTVFTPYAGLTEAQVIGWVQDTMGTEQVTAYEENVSQQINNQIVPPVVTPPLPWGV
jgi:hypothetical protein